MKFHIKVYSGKGVENIDDLKTTDDLVRAMSKLDELNTRVIVVEADSAYINSGCLILQDNCGQIKMALAKDSWIGVATSE